MRIIEFDGFPFVFNSSEELVEKIKNLQDQESLYISITFHEENFNVTESQENLSEASSSSSEEAYVSASYDNRQVEIDNRMVMYMFECALFPPQEDSVMFLLVKNLDKVVTFTPLTDFAGVSF